MADLAAEYAEFERQEAAGAAADALSELLRSGLAGRVPRGVVGELLKTRGFLWLAASELRDFATDPWHVARGRQFALRGAEEIEALLPRISGPPADALREAAGLAREASGAGPTEREMPPATQRSNIRSS